MSGLITESQLCTVCGRTIRRGKMVEIHASIGSSVEYVCESCVMSIRSGKEVTVWATESSLSINSRDKWDIGKEE